MSIRVRVGDDHHEVEPGTTAGQLLLELDEDPAKLIAALLNDHLVSLDTPLGVGARLTAVRVGERAARAVLRRTSALLFHAAAAEVYPAMRLVIGQTLRGADFYEFMAGSGAPLEAERVAVRIREAIEGLLERRPPILRSRMPVESAPALLTDEAGSKARLLRTWTAPFVPIVQLGGFVDVQHGPLAPSLEFARGLELEPWTEGEEGLLLYPPNARKQKRSAGLALYATYRETRGWNRRVGVETVGDLNNAVLDGRVDDVIRVTEALHEKKIAEIADAIAQRRDKVRFVYVAGPSSSGKTTFVRRLVVQLRVNGIEPHPIGLDDYYRPRDETPVDENGEHDFEALEALDLPLIDQHLERLQAGEEIEVPRFDFTRGQRAPGEPLHVREGEVALIEGIHGLNPRMSAAVDDDACYRIYINALTQLVIDDHNRINTADGRLLRRIVRDRRYRGTRAAETILRWPSVRRGEEKHIFPWDEHADATFNSALLYEPAVLKTFAWRYLLEVPRNHPARVEAHRLLHFLEHFVPVFPDDVPANSVLREFIGGSGFAY
jgi:uridine kinase